MPGITPAHLSQQYLQLDDPITVRDTFDGGDLRVPYSVNILSPAKVPVSPRSSDRPFWSPMSSIRLPCCNRPAHDQRICLRAGSEASHSAIIAREMADAQSMPTRRNLDAVKMGDA